MTDKEIITMAGEYGAWVGGHEISFTDAGLLEFARALEKAEREACARLCEEGVDTEHPTVEGHIMKNFGASAHLANAIRARKEL